MGVGCCGDGCGGDNGVSDSDAEAGTGVTHGVISDGELIGPPSLASFCWVGRGCLENMNGTLF